MAASVAPNPAGAGPFAVWPFDLADDLRTVLICPRVSLQRQKDAGTSMESQEIELHAFCASRQLRVTASAPWVGTATLRRGDFWDNAFGILARGEAHIIMFWEAARMTRRGDWHGFSRLERIEEMGRDWYICSVGDDVKRVDSWEYRSHILTSHFNGAKRFIITLKEAVKRGQRTVLQGQKITRDGTLAPPSPVGVAKPALGLAWGTDAKGNRDRSHFVVVEGKPGWATIEFAYDMAPIARSGWGLAKALNQAGHRTREGKEYESRTALDLIRNPIYMGEHHGHRWEFYYTDEEKLRKREKPLAERTIIPNFVRRENGLDIISAERWQIANAALAEGRAKNWRNGTGPRAVLDPFAHLLRGIGECGYCHNALSCTWKTKRGKSIPIYMCNSANRPTGRCRGIGTAEAPAVDREIWAAINARVADPTAVRQAVEEAQAQAAPREAEAASLKRAIARRKDDWVKACRAYNVHEVGSRSYDLLKGDADELETQLDEAERDLARVEAAASQDRLAADDLARLEDWLREQADQLPGAGPEERQKFLLASGAEVFLYRRGEATDGSGRRWRVPTLDAVLPEGSVAGVSLTRYSSHPPLRVSLLPLPPPEGLAAD